MKHVVLPPQMDRGAAAMLATEIADAIGSGPVEIDGTAVARIGQCGLQLLLSARATAHARGGQVDILASPAIHEAARLTGLEAHLFEGAAA